MRKLITIIVTVLAAVALSVTVFAAGACTGKVTKVEGDKVTVTLAAAAPAWAKKGASVSALGGTPKVVSVDGQDVVLKMSKEKAAKVKVDTKVTLSRPDLQGC